MSDEDFDRRLGLAAHNNAMRRPSRPPISAIIEWLRPPICAPQDRSICADPGHHRCEGVMARDLGDLCSVS